MDVNIPGCTVSKTSLFPFSGRTAVDFSAALAGNAYKGRGVIILPEPFRAKARRGDNMEKRVAVVETEVAYIKSGVAELQIASKELSVNMADSRKDIAVILQKMVDVERYLSKKPDSNEMSAAITLAVNKQIVWTIVTASAVLGIARWIF